MSQLKKKQKKTQVIEIVLNIRYRTNYTSTHKDQRSFSGPCAHRPAAQLAFVWNICHVYPAVLTNESSLTLTMCGQVL